MREQWPNWTLAGILALGLLNLGMMVFRGTFAAELGEAGRVWASDRFDVPRRAFGAPAAAGARPVALRPDAVTGATPRVIAAQIDGMIQRLRSAVVGIRAGSGAAAPLWQQGAAAPAGWSVGSGVIVHPHGHIVTNYHVVSQPGVIRVTVFSGAGMRDYPARLIAASPAQDLALLKVEAPVPLTSVPIGNSDLVRTGDQVLAVGNPFALSQTVTKGMVSARRRRVPIGNNVLPELLQTDVPINPGNSGGALCNLRGQLIGINVAIYSPVEAVFTGVSFAIPINDVNSLYGPYMDFSQQPVNFAWPVAGGTPLPRPTAPLDPTLTGPGTTDADTWRANPARLPAGAKRIMPAPGEGIEELAWLGIDLTPDSAVGVEVDEIEGISPMEAGLQAGDIIRGINGIPVPDMYALKDAIKKVPLKAGQGVVLDVFRPRENRTMFISFRMKKFDLRGR